MKLDANARPVRTVSAALAAAAAVFEARVVVSLALGESAMSTGALDYKLHALEAAYRGRADELAKKRKPKRRSRKARK